MPPKKGLKVKSGQKKEKETKHSLRKNSDPSEEVSEGKIEKKGKKSVKMSGTNKEERKDTSLKQQSSESNMKVGQSSESSTRKKDQEAIGTHPMSTRQKS